MIATSSMLATSSWLHVVESAWLVLDFRCCGGMAMGFFSILPAADQLLVHASAARLEALCGEALAGQCGVEGRVGICEAGGTVCFPCSC